MRKILFIALSLVLLCACTGFVNASINVKGIYGIAGIIGFRTANDSLTANVTSTADNVTMDNVLCSCVKKGSYYCTCNVQDEQDKPIVYYDFSNGIKDSVQASIKVDDSIGDMDFSVQNTHGNASISYNVLDTGYNGDNGCSGIKTIDVYANTEVINTIDINTTQCSIMGNAILNADSGLKEFYIIATDNVGNTKESVHKNYSIDVSAPDINNLEIRMFGKSLTAIAQNTELPVDISFDISENNLANITADLSNINNNPAIKAAYKKVIVPISSCYLNTSDNSSDTKIYNCIIKAKTMRTPNNYVNITITASDTYGNINIRSFTTSFTLDSIKPSAIISSGACDSKGKCYVKNGINNINVLMNKQNFDSSRVFVMIDAKTYPMINCTSGMCTGPVLISCTSGSEIIASISALSQDDSGNKVSPSSVSFKCDNNPPKILNVTFSGQNLGVQYQDLIMSKSNVMILATVYDLESDELMNVTANLGDMKNSTESSSRCVKDFTTNIFNCTWTILNIQDGYYKTDITLNFSDIIGNTVQKAYSVTVLGLKDNSTPDSLQLSLKSVVPNSVNRIALDLANTNRLPFFVYAQYTITAKTMKKSKLLFQAPGDCVFKNVDSGEYFSYGIFSKLQIADQYSGLGTIDRMDFTFDNNLHVNDLPDNFIAYCNISAFIKEDDIVYKNPQILTIEVPFNLRNAQLGTPAQMFEDKIRKEEDGFLYKLEFLGIVNGILPKIQRICELRNYFQMASFAGSLLSTVGSAVSPVFGPGLQNGGMMFTIHVESLANCFYGDPRTQSASRGMLYGQVTNLQNPQQQNPNGQPTITAGGTATAAADLGTCTNLVRDTCDFLSCNVAEKFENTSTGPLTNIFDLNETWTRGIGKNLNTPDVSNSLIMAAYTQCWPAVIYNMNKWRQIDCGYVYCLKETSLRGTDISVCDKAKGIQTCNLIVGEIFELPGVNIGKNFINNIGEIINSIGPLAAVSITKVAYCDKYLDVNAPPPTEKDFDATKIWICQVPLQVARFVDGMKRSTRAATFHYPEIQDMCEMAKHVGEPNYQYQTNFWNTIDQLRIPSSQLDNRDYGFVKIHTDTLKTIQTDRTVQLGKVQSNKDAFTQYSSIQNGPEADIALAKAEKDPASVNPEVVKLLKLDQAEYKEQRMIDCGHVGCDTVIAVGPNGQAQTKSFADLTPQEQQIKINNDQVAFERLQALQKIIDANPNKYAQGDLVKARNNYLCQLGRCTMKGTTCDVCTPLSSEELAKKQKELSNERTIVNAQQFGFALNVALQILYQNHVLDFMMTANWGDSAMKVVQFFDTENWKKNLCNPDFGQGIVGPNAGDSGNVVNCDNGNCVPILTMAAESQYFEQANTTKNNSKYYLYTIAYYLGPVIIPQNTNLGYNIEFRGPQGTVKGYVKTIRYLPNNQIIRIAKSFAHVKSFTQMCIVFDQDYPPLQTGAKKEFCRTIKADDFNTGSPYVDQSASYYNNQPISQPSRIFTGIAKNNEPGVLE